MALPYIKFYVNDWLNDTEELEYDVKGIYIELLAKMWNSGGSLPDDDEFIAKKTLRISFKKWTKYRSILFEKLPKSFYVTEGRLHNKRLQKEYEGAAKKSKSKSDNANLRWGNDANAYANASSNEYPIADAKAERRAYDYDYKPDLNNKSLEGSGVKIKSSADILADFELRASEVIPKPSTPKPIDNGSQQEFVMVVCEYWRLTSQGNVIPPHHIPILKEIWGDYGTRQLLWALSQFRYAGLHDLKHIRAILTGEKNLEYIANKGLRNSKFETAKEITERNTDYYITDKIL